MEWTPGGVSNDIEDRRDDSGGGGGFRGLHLGIGGMILVGILSLLFHQNLFTLFSAGGSQTAHVESRPDPQRDRAEQPEVQFVSFVLDDVRKNWERMLPESQHVPYRHAKLVLFRNAYPSRDGRGCGWTFLLS